MEHLQSLIGSLLPGYQVERVRRLDVDEAVHEASTGTGKCVGYGKSLRITVCDRAGHHRELVLHTATANDYGHDRRSDRAGEMLLGFDTFASIPRHVRSVDVGAVDVGGVLHSLRDCGEFYLLTEFAPGTLYADDLRRIAREGHIDERDVARCDRLIDYLVDLHSRRGGRRAVYTRAIRDLVGHGEGIFGVVDGYPDGTPGATPERLSALEQRCAQWRWRLRGDEARLTLTHGDLHPFNILFDDDDGLALLDASRGCQGDPADDVTCLALNYVFFALGVGDAWREAMAPLWFRFWRGYLSRTGDTHLLQVAPPFLAWRALVMCNPRWYPALDEQHRDSLLGLVERGLDAGRFDPEWAEELFQ